MHPRSDGVLPWGHPMHHPCVVTGLVHGRRHHHRLLQRYFLIRRSFHSCQIRFLIHRFCQTCQRRRLSAHHRHRQGRVCPKHHRSSRQCVHHQSIHHPSTQVLRHRHHRLLQKYSRILQTCQTFRFLIHRTCQTCHFQIRQTCRTFQRERSNHHRLLRIRRDRPIRRPRPSFRGGRGWRSWRICRPWICRPFLRPTCRSCLRRRSCPTCRCCSTNCWKRNSMSVRGGSACPMIRGHGGHGWRSCWRSWSSQTCRPCRRRSCRTCRC
mmetsp:Transcript_16087/g.26220  ORF Transcript_16087/g.26220 Transcript_16087/m.26220 type:complete len:266 (+) Transcript_16087:769-1566(+)